MMRGPPGSTPTRTSPSKACQAAAAEFAMTETAKAMSGKDTDHTRMGDRTGSDKNESSFFSPREIVSELDRFIIGQNDAKRAVAIALRNRWRRQQLPEDLRDEVLPKNILMIGPTGVGKTEIARRLAKLAQAPFIKVEATKFTEIGYVGRDGEENRKSTRLNSSH